MGPGGRVAWFARTWCAGACALVSRMWRVVGDGCRRSPTTLSLVRRVPLESIAESCGAVEHTPIVWSVMCVRGGENYG